MRQRHGIAGLPSYQEGGQHVPQEDIPLAIPDTLMGADRARVMDFFHRMDADTTQISQAEFHDYFNSPEFRDVDEFLRELRGGPPPSTRVHSEATATAGEYHSDKDEIDLNLLYHHLPRHGRGTSIEFTKEGWERGGGDELRDTHLHEVHHALQMDPSDMNPYYSGVMKQRPSDNFAAIFKAVQDAEPGDSRKDVLREAVRLYWEGSNAYKLRRARGATTGLGIYDDPYVVSPQFKEAISNRQMEEMEPHLDSILATEKFADHPLNIYDRLSRGEKIRRGIGSLFSRLLGRNES